MPVTTFPEARALLLQLVELHKRIVSTDNDGTWQTPDGTTLETFPAFLDRLEDAWDAAQLAVFAARDYVADLIAADGAIEKTTYAALAGDLAHDEGVKALVLDDPTPALNGLYTKLGASGAGSWSQTGSAPIAVEAAARESGDASLRSRVSGLLDLEPLEIVSGDYGVMSVDPHTGRIRLMRDSEFAPPADIDRGYVWGLVAGDKVLIGVRANGKVDLQLADPPTSGTVLPDDTGWMPGRTAGRRVVEWIGTEGRLADALAPRLAAWEESGSIFVDDGEQATEVYAGGDARGAQVVARTGVQTAIGSAGSRRAAIVDALGRGRVLRRRLVHVVCVGQSNSNGTAFGDPITTTPPAPGLALMWAGADTPRVPEDLRGAEYGARPDDARFTGGWTDLREAGIGVDGETFVQSETICSGAAAQLLDSIDDAAFLFSVHGFGSQTLAKTQPGTPPFDNLEYSIIRAMDQAAQMGLSYEVPAIVWVGHESNYSTDRATYLATLQVQMQVAADRVAALTGRTPTILMPVLASWTKFGAKGPTSDQPLSVQDAADEGLLEIPCPLYTMTYGSDGVHMDPASHRLLGAYVGRHLVAQLLDAPRAPLRIASAQRVDDTIVVTLTGGGAGSVAIDTAETYVADPGDYGFTWSGSGSIESVTVTGPAEITIGLSAGSAGTLGYAFIGTPNASAGPTSGPRGSVYVPSSDVAVAGGQPLHDWLLPYSIAVA